MNVVAVSDVEGAIFHEGGLDMPALETWVEEQGTVVGFPGSKPCDDLLTLDVFANLAARLDDPATSADDAVVDESEAEDAAASAGPLTLAIDVQGEAGEPEPAATAAAAG